MSPDSRLPGIVLSYPDSVSYMGRAGHEYTRQWTNVASATFAWLCRAMLEDTQDSENSLDR